MQNTGTQPTAEGMEQVCFVAACGCAGRQMAWVLRYRAQQQLTPLGCVA